MTLPLPRFKTAAQDRTAIDAVPDRRRTERPDSRWMGWRARTLAAAALIGCIAVLCVVRWLSEAPSVHAGWRNNMQGQIELGASADPVLKPHQGRALIGLIGSGDNSVAVVDALALERSPRWLTDDSERERQLAMHEQLSSALSNERVKLFFSEGEMVELRPQPRGIGQLGLMFWTLSALSLVLYLVALVVALANPVQRNFLFALMSLCQAGNLCFMAIESTIELGLPPLLTRWDMPVRMAFDLVTATAFLHVASLHPRRIAGSAGMAGAAWGIAAVLIGLAAFGHLPGIWWWTQSAAAAMMLGAIGLSTWSYHIEPHPFAMLMQRFGIAAVSTWILLSVALTAVDELPAVQQQIAAVGPTIWYVFLTSLLVLVPFLSRSQQVMREFALLAAVSTVATSLDLLFVAVFSMGQFASVTLALFVSLGLYTGARQWLLNQMRSNNMMTTERMFEKLYRVAREVEARPDMTPTLVMRLLRELFEPLAIELIDARGPESRVQRDGSDLIVPIPDLGTEGPARAVLIRYGGRGRRLFNSEDARLTDRIVEQLQRAVAYDRAVEQGRSEERSRLAQDLHDDIGARLLTLMYKSQSPEMEDYLRHTLQDLKTLTRGLAAANHPLSHAAAEWKADLTQRLTMAQIELDWRCVIDSEVHLTVVQWSGLTRVIRELISNILAHSQAQRVHIELQLDNDRLDLTLIDDGIGRNPQSWSHGLGLGGVRKRVKQLGGEVEWREAAPRGISCRVCIRQLSMPA